VPRKAGREIRRRNPSINSGQEARAGPEGVAEGDPTGYNFHGKSPAFAKATDRQVGFCSGETANL